MTGQAFDTRIEDDGARLIGPYRQPLQMLAEQEYDDHASIHDDATAQKLGFKGGTIEGPTHFSQIVPLCVAQWGDDWLAEGCISALYRNACYEGDAVRAILEKPAAGEGIASIRVEREDGMEVLRGTASIGPGQRTALDEKLEGLTPPEPRIILRDVSVGMKRPRVTVRMDAKTVMGKLYPFTLADKLTRITEPSPWYAADDNRWGRPLIPFEMVSVLLNHISDNDPWTVHGPVVGLFADQEIRMIKGPLFVGQDYEVEREIVGLSGSRRTESLWVRSSVFLPGGSECLVTMLLNLASLKESYAHYERDLAALA